MATTKYLRWLQADNLTTNVAKRFAEFCKDDVEERAADEHFDMEIYEDAVRLIVDRLEGVSAVKEDDA